MQALEAERSVLTGLDPSFIVELAMCEVVEQKLQDACKEKVLSFMPTPERVVSLEQESLG